MEQCSYHDFEVFRINSRIVEYKHFETGVGNILEGKDEALTVSEIIQCTVLRRNESDGNDEMDTIRIQGGDFANGLWGQRFTLWGHIFSLSKSLIH